MSNPNTSKQIQNKQLVKIVDFLNQPFAIFKVLSWIVLAMFSVFLINKLMFPLVLDESANYGNIFTLGNTMSTLPVFHWFYYLVNVLSCGSFVGIRLSSLLLTVIIYLSLQSILHSMLPGEKKNKYLVTLFTTLFFIIPVNISSYLFIDENFLLSVGISSFLALMILYNQQQTMKLFILQVLIYFVMLWTKFTTELILPFFTGFIVLFKSRFSDTKINLNLKQVITLYTIPVALFFSTFYFFVTYFNIYPYSFLTPFKYMLEKNMEFDPRRLVVELNLLLLYLSPYYWILMLLMTWDAITKKVKIPYFSVLMLLYWLIVFFYMRAFMFSGSYPKYFIPIFHLSIVLISTYIFQKIKSWTIKDMVILSILVAFYYLFLKDPVLYSKPLVGFVFRDPSFRNEFIFSTATKLLVIIVPSIFFFFQKDKLKYLFLLLLAYSLSFGAQQAFSNYSTQLAYGERGLKQTIKFCETIIKPTDKLYVVKDVDNVLFKHHRNADLYLEYGADVVQHLKYINEIQPKVVIYRDYWIEADELPIFRQALETLGYKELFRSGNFFVTKKG